MTARLEDIVRDWPAVVPLWPDAASAFGLGRSGAYDLVRRGEFPCRVLRLGRHIRVAKADLLMALGATTYLLNAETPDAVEARTGASVAADVQPPGEGSCRADAA